MNAIESDSPDYPQLSTTAPGPGEIAVARY
jgi:hypothetical protein